MKYMSYSAFKTAMTRNSYMTDFQVVSRRQVELGYLIRSFRESHDMTLQDLAFRCSCFGKPFKVKFTNVDISQYERFQSIPTERKMNVLMMAIGITKEDIDKRI